MVSWNLHDLLQTKVLMQPFVYCLCKEKRGHFSSVAWRLREVIKCPILLCFPSSILTGMDVSLSRQHLAGCAKGMELWGPCHENLPKAGWREGNNCPHLIPPKCKREGDCPVPASVDCTWMTHIQIKIILWPCPGHCAAHLCCFF